MADNTVTLVGNVTRDPELRYTQGGKGVAAFGLAVSRRYQQNNEWQEVTSFFDVTAWAPLAENVAQSISKGNRVVVTGRLEQREWESDGGKRTKVEVVADEIGPSLRWATCTVTRVERSDSSAPRPSGTSGGARSVPADEEPF